jgi:hypothetical protein
LVSASTGPKDYRRSGPGDPHILQWHISEPNPDDDAAEKRRAFKKTLTELETRIRLFVLVNKKKAPQSLLVLTYEWYTKRGKATMKRPAA